MFTRNISDDDILRLKKRRKHYKIIYWCYFLLSVVIGFIIGIVGSTSIFNVLDFGVNSGLGLILLGVVLISINTLLTMFLYFMMESHHYKNKEMYCDLLVYLKDNENKKIVGGKKYEV